MMTKRFAIGFSAGLLLFLTINLLATHLASDCGLLAVLGRDACADDIARAGWPLQFYEDGGFAYRHNFNPFFLLINLGIGLVVGFLSGRFFSHSQKPLPK